MANLDVGVQLYYDGVWNELVDAGEVFAGTPITITQGLAGEGAALRPANTVLQLDNRTDKYRPTNPTGTLYGKVGRNTPMRIQVGSSTRAAVELSSVACDQTRDFRQSPMRGRKWADVQAGGLLQRVNSWSRPIRSPFYRFNERMTTLSGYWPLEDDVGIKSLQSPVANTRTLIVRGVEFQSQTRPVGSGPVTVIPPNTNQLMGGRFIPYDGNATDGYQLGFAINFGSLGTTGNVLTFFSWETWDGATYSLTWLDGKDLIILGNARDGTNLITSGGAWTGINVLSNWSEWQNFKISATYSGGNTTISLSWNTEGIGTGIAGPYTATLAGTPPSRLMNWFSQFGGTTDGLALGHVIGTNGTSEDLFSADRVSAFNGYIGEKAASRFARLCTEENLAYYVKANWASSIPLGPQAVDTVQNLFKEIADTDDALIYDVRDEIRLIYMSRADRYRQTPALTLTTADFPANGNGSLPVEAFDNDGKFNIVTVSQRAGGDYTTADDTGPLSTQPPPDGIGDVKRTFDVTVANEIQTLPQVANWWLRRGTVDLPRFPQLTLDLAARPSLVSAVDAIEVGDVIEITGFRENTIRLHILGWTEKIGWPHARTITFNCASDQQFVIGQLDATDSRIDSKTHFLKTGVNAAATSITFRSLSSKVAWSTTTPYDVICSGERLRVTAMGAASLVSGGYDQVATVTRSINGVSKSLAANEEIHPFTPGRLAI